jgi:hypothetical protein
VPKEYEKRFEVIAANLEWVVPKLPENFISLRI